MDNQEAIRLIRNLPTMCEFADAYGEPIDSDAYYEAVDMAISALEKQDEIISEIQNAIKEIRNSEESHAKQVTDNGELICEGSEIALDIVRSKA